MMARPIMSVDDWFEMFTSTPGFIERGWGVELNGHIRDAQDFCPICAWALLQHYPGRRYTGAYRMALDQVFGGNFVDYEAADQIAAAADNVKGAPYIEIRAVLLHYLNLKERT
jgi:hypothetical protein